MSSYPLNIPSFPNVIMPYKSIAVKEEVYNLIKENARKELRGISNYLEHKLTRE